MGDHRPEDCGLGHWGSCLWCSCLRATRPGGLQVPVRHLPPRPLKREEDGETPPSFAEPPADRVLRAATAPGNPGSPPRQGIEERLDVGHLVVRQFHCQHFGAAMTLIASIERGDIAVVEIGIGERDVAAASVS